MSQRSDLLKRRRNRAAARRQISEEEKNEKKERAVLNMVPTNYPSTLGNSFIDFAFKRNITTKLLNWVCYFLYHRPILPKIVTNRNCIQY
ncbi:hypothetical protein AVEN_205965-1 [Araneus ventricosus]|uniref:Uncharacterized protein n=1 Tax=Araneus ventricosus TaxID=182803 RepID=A0A4Y2TQX4_ARAVE|nr:hypothetical protein AVEN_205965-1 [Araneus ventricosus]